MSNSLYEQKRNIRREIRSLDRQRASSKREEEKIKAEMKVAANKGDMDTVRMLAKHLIKMREQDSRMQKITGVMQSLSHKVTQQNSQVKLTQAIQSMNSAMQAMNKHVNVNDIQKMTQALARENEKMNMMDELMDDAFEGMFDEHEDEETDQVMKEILEQVNLETSSKMKDIQPSRSVVSNSVSSVANEAEEEDDELNELEKRLNRLRQSS